MDQRPEGEVMEFLTYWARVAKCVVKGSRAYYIWMASLLVLLAIGLISWWHHIQEGLVVSNMTDQVSWGIGIANFVYFVGVGAAAALVIVPAYVADRKDIKEIVILAQLLAVAAVVSCLLFIVSDLGRPERMWHLSPGLGVLNLPQSLLAWDVVVFTGYLLLNLSIPMYVLYKMYRGERPRPLLYIPLLFITMFWAVGIHTVTAFLLSGLGTRHFWNTAILAPRFLITTAASGPAIYLLLFNYIRRNTALRIQDSVFEYLKAVLRLAMPINLFLLACDVFTEFYPGTTHSIAARYLYFGLGTHHMLPKFIWTAIALNISAAVIFLVPKLRNNQRIMYTGCVFTIFGIWTEKGMGLVFPGFTPSPLGEVVEYAPNLAEILVCVGVLALGALMFTAFAKVAIAIQTGSLRLTPDNTPATDGDTEPTGSDQTAVAH